MKDYATSHYSLRQKMPSPAVGSWRQVSRAQNPVRQALVWRVMGVVLICAMVVGLMVSFWVGHSIQESLSGIAQAQEIQGYESQLKDKLLQEREQILAGKKFEALAAVQVGLFSPASRQRVGFR